MITFTIITCTFNAAETLQRTLDSIASQDYPHFTHIIQDGLSKDDTENIALRHIALQAERQGRTNTTWIREKDNGLYDAMNRAMRKATGDYILFLNAGDTLPQVDTLSHIASRVAETTCLPAVLYGDTDIVDMQGKIIRHRRLAPPRNLTWKDFKKGMLVCHQAFYVRKDFAQEHPYDLSYRYSADVDWCIRIMHEAQKRHIPLIYIDRVVAHFLDGGMTTQHHRVSLKERFQVMRKHYGLPTTMLMHGFFVIRMFTKK